MYFRSLILLLVAGCALVTLPAVGQISAESCGPSYFTSEYHYFKLQPSYNLRWDGRESNGAAIDYFVSNSTNTSALGIGCDFRDAEHQTAALYLDAMFFTTESLVINGPYVSGGLGMNFAENPQLEVRLGFGYALPLGRPVSMIFSLTNRIVGVHPFSNIGANVISGLGVGFAFNFAETDWGLW